MHTPASTPRIPAFCGGGKRGESPALCPPPPCPGPAGTPGVRAAPDQPGCGRPSAPRAAARTPRERQGNPAGCSTRLRPLARQPHRAPAGLMPLAHLRAPSFPGGPGCRCCISLRAAGRNGTRLREKPSKERAVPAAPAGGRRRSPRRAAAPRSPGSGRRSTAQPRLTSPPRLGSGDAPQLLPCPPPPAPSLPARRSGAEGAQRQLCGAVGAMGSPPPSPRPRCTRDPPPAAARSPPLPVPSASPPQPAAGPPPRPKPCNLP